MLLDESCETARHAKPVRCPRCRKSSLVLIFDSPARGMVCPHCHEKLIMLRKRDVGLAGGRTLPPGTARNTKRVASCPRCGQAAPLLLFDSPQAGMVCHGCHGDLVRFRQEVAGLIPDAG
ncbi:MAG: hypothetical protein NNA30_11655 [Nitrospira sp.]|jgi:ribosomal protein S27E|nr:hypothetical protein [Nitrospira sp.]